MRKFYAFIALAYFAGIASGFFIFSDWYWARVVSRARVTVSPSVEHPNWVRAAEEAFAQLTPANIAFHAPQAMEFEKTIPIELLLSLSESIDELKIQIAAIGEKHGYEIRASSQMEATLRAARDSAFKVIAVTPETQNLRGTERTRWEWRVTPLEWGPQELELTISALYAIDGRDGKRAIRVFQHDILVNVTYWQKTKVFLRSNWQWAWTALLVPVAGAVWVWLRKRRRPTFDG